MENINPRWNILYVEDDEDDYVLMQAMLSKIEKHAIHLEWARDYQEALQKLTAREWDAVLVDYDLGSNNGIHLIQDATSHGVTSPLIMVTGRGRYEVDVEAMQAGAYDYVTKVELTSPLLERVIRYAKERQRAEKMLEQRIQARTQELQTALEELQVMEEELRVQLDETLQSQEDREAILQRYRNLFEDAPSAYIITDPSGVILDANLAATKLLNRRKDYVVGKPLVVFIPEENRPAFRSKLNQLSPTQAIQEWDMPFQPSSLHVVRVHVVVSPVRSVDGKLITLRWLIYEKVKTESESSDSLRDRTG